MKEEKEYDTENTRGTSPSVIPCLVFLILQPSVEGTKSYTAFLIIVIAVEAALLANWKKKAAIDIGIIVFVALILWEYITAKVGVKDAMLYPGTGKMYSTFL